MAHKVTGDASDNEVLDQFSERLKLCQEVWKEQRTREKEDLKFQLPEMQWDDGVRRSREGNGSDTSGRPTVSVSLLDQPINLITNQMRSADLGVQIHPVSETAEKDTAEAMQGIYRFIEREGADLARDWAYDRSVKAGMGYYRVVTEYDEAGGQPGDQKILIKRILYQDGVYLDPSAQEADFSDGEYAFVLSWMTAAEFKRRWPKSKMKGASGVAEKYYDTIPDWVRFRDGKKEPDVLVGEYWYKVKKFEQFTLPSGDEREREVVTVFRAVVGGNELLEDPVKWPGKWIPIVPVIGRELQPFDDNRYWIGMVRPARDPQRGYNYSLSAGLEAMALEPKQPYIGDARAFQNYEEYWKQANVKNYPYLPYNGGTQADPIPPPQRQQVDSSKLQLSMQMAEAFRNNVQAATSVFDPSLGRVPQQDRSGKAIMALQEQAESGTSHFLQNFAKVTLPYEAMVVLDLMPIIYDRPERVTRIVTGEDRKDKAIMINAPFVPGQDPNGRPVPANPQQPGAKFYRITEGTYGVSVSIGKSYQTRLQEGAEMVGEVLAKQPALVPIVGDIFYRYQDFPGAKEIADRLAKVREQQYPGLGDDEGQPTSPEQLKGALARQGQQMQAMGQQMQAMQHALETEQAKQQAQMMKAQLDARIKMQELQAEMAKATREDETKRVIAAADNETKLLIADLANQMRVMLETLGLQKEAMIAERQAENDERDREHEAVMTAAGRQADRDDAETGREAEREDADAQRKHEAAMSALSTPAPQRPKA